MTFTRFGRNITAFIASAFILAACAQTEAPADTTPTPEPEEKVAPTPDPVITAPIKSATEMALEMGATVDGLIAYAGTDADRVFFAYDSAELSTDAQAMLAKQAEWMSHFDGTSIMVQGHCDERGTREYNLALGALRAEAVKNYLVTLGVSSYQIKTISYGKERPVAVGPTESSWSRNRRGQIVIN